MTGFARFVVFSSFVAFLAFDVFDVFDVFLFPQPPRQRPGRLRGRASAASAESEAVPRPELPMHGATIGPLGQLGQFGHWAMGMRVEQLPFYKGFAFHIVMGISKMAGYIWYGMVVENFRQKWMMNRGTPMTQETSKSPLLPLFKV